MDTRSLLHNPRFVRWGVRIDRVPAAAWLLLQGLALAPTWIWMARRLSDGSDDPLGLLALCALAVLVWQARGELRSAPRRGWLAAAMLMTALATLGRSGIAAWPALPPLLGALLAVLALGCALVAYLPRHVAATPVVGLAVLSLPLLSSLQFYVGYPLRVVTAEASRWLLAPGFEVQREGSSLWVDGMLVIVDAPCSGVQMAWLGYFTACVVAVWTRRRGGDFLARLPATGLLVLVGNIVRNSVLVACEAAGKPLSDAAHNSLGLAVLAAVCGGIAVVMARPSRPTHRTNATIRGVRHATPA